MSSPALTSETNVATPRTEETRRWRALLLFLTLGVLWFGLCRFLSNEWSNNEQYAYGWFVPFLALFLAWLNFETGNRRRETGDGRSEMGVGIGGKVFTLAFLLLAALLPLRVFEIANPDWRPLGWIHALIVVGYTLFVIGYWGGARAVRQFAFPVCFIFVAVPWPTPIEMPIVQGLMRMVAAVSAEAVSLLGVPAQVEGTVIHVATGAVGVNEACSGVRSLQTSLMIGLLFGELKRLSVGRRVALLIGAVLIALVANFVRTSFLVWIAAQDGVPAVGKWHDFAGYSIVVAVVLGTVALASALARKTEMGGKAVEKGESRNEKGEKRGNFHLPAFSFLISCLVWLLVVEAAAAGWYRAHEGNLAPRTRWTVRWPESAPGFHDVRINENVRRTLRYDEGRGAAWRAEEPLAAANVSPNDSSEMPAARETRPACLLYFFRWNPGGSSVLRARAHRPDICLPNVGWRQTADDGARWYQGADNVRLPFRHFEFVTNRSGPGREFAHAFFCVREDWVRTDQPEAGTNEQVTGKVGGWGRWDRWRAVVEGERDLGQQVMELVMVSKAPIPKAEAEQRFGEMVGRTVEAVIGGR